MKISTKGRYALRMMLDLAEHREQGFVSLKEIAARQDISKKYLEQIVAVLNRPDFLKTNRGYQGGLSSGQDPGPVYGWRYSSFDRGRLGAGGLPGGGAEHLPPRRFLRYAAGVGRAV